MTVSNDVGEVPSRPAGPAVSRPRVYPGPPLREVPGLLVKLWRDRLGLLSDAAGEYGDVVRFDMGPKTIYFFNHPDHAKHVLTDNPANYRKGMGLSEARRILGDGLLTSEGETWRRQRQVISPAFRRERVATFAGVIADAGAALTRRLDAHVGAGTVDLAREMTALTMDVLGRMLLDADLSQMQMLGAPSMWRRTRQCSRCLPWAQCRCGCRYPATSGSGPHGGSWRTRCGSSSPRGRPPRISRGPT